MRRRWTGGDRQSVDLDRYLSRRVTVRNVNRARYDQGLRTFSCPLCGDRKGRGWFNTERWVAGCHNAGCYADPSLPGIQWVQAVEHLDRAGAWRFLLAEFPGRGLLAPRRHQADRPETDWVKFPREVRWLRDLDSVSPLALGPLGFARDQWGLTRTAACEWNLGVCWTGPYARRLIIPVPMPEPVAFQARALVGQEPKYKTSAFQVECARPGSALLFNYQPALRGAELLLVEGPGDVMGWHCTDRHRRPHAVGLLGVALTPEKLSLLAQCEPSAMVLALDAEPEAQARAAAYLEDLRAWGFTVQLGEWVGAKDAGAGADLRRVPPGPPGPHNLIKNQQLRGH